MHYLQAAARRYASFTRSVENDSNETSPASWAGGETPDERVSAAEAACENNVESLERAVIQRRNLLGRILKIAIRHDDPLSARVPQPGGHGHVLGRRCGSAARR